MHKQNDVVVYVENGVETNALVVSSNALSDLHPGQTAGKDTPVVEHLTLVTVPSVTQGVQNLTPISHGIFLRTIFGVRPLTDEKAAGWYDRCLACGGGRCVSASHPVPGTVANSTQSDWSAVGIVGDYTMADLPKLLGKKVIVDLGTQLNQFKEGIVTDPQPEASADVPPSIHVFFGDSALWISADMIIAVVDDSGHLAGAEVPEKATVSVETAVPTSNDVAKQEVPVTAEDPAPAVVAEPPAAVPAATPEPAA